MVVVSYLVHYDTLSQKATAIITKCDRYFITKYDKSLLKNASSFLLKKVTNVLENETVFTNCKNFIKKWDNY